MTEAAPTHPGIAHVEIEHAPRGLIADRYRVVRSLGHGGMGEVLLAEDQRLNRRVAIKRSHTGESGSKLGREARIAARIAHRGVAQVHDLVRCAGVDHLVLELVDGPRLFDLHRAGPVDPAEAARIAIELTCALTAVHRRGVLHLDIKLENVLLDAEGQPKLIDFGIARCADEIDVEVDPRTQLIGTPRAMSPEQIQGDPVDARSDLYSLGVLIFELVAGTSPFGGVSKLQTLSRVLDEPPPRIDALAPRAPAELAALVDELLAKSPERRPPSACEVERRLWSIALALA